MFIDRAQIKQDARYIIGTNTLWLQMFLAMFLVSLPTSITSSVSGSLNSFSTIFQTQGDTDSSSSIIFALLGIMAIFSILQTAVSILTVPFSIGLSGYQLCAIRNIQKPEVFYPYKLGKQHYGRFLGTGLLMGIMIFLWSLLLIIPGIIMTYAYMFVPYIICENPELTPSQALDISKRMTKGFKLDLFIMHLSFFLWSLGVVCTFGLLAIYVTPYMQAVQVLYYEKLKEHAIKAGVVSADELGFVASEQNRGFDYSPYNYYPANSAPVVSNPDYEPYQPNFSAAPVDQFYPVNDSIYDIYNKNAAKSDEPAEENNNDNTETED